MHTKHDPIEDGTHRVTVTVAAASYNEDDRRTIATAARSYALKVAREHFGPSVTVSMLGGYWCQPAPWYRNTRVVAYRVNNYEGQ